MLRPNWIEIGWAMNVSRNPKMLFCGALRIAHASKCDEFCTFISWWPHILHVLRQITCQTNYYQFHKMQIQLHKQNRAFMVLHRGNDWNHWLTCIVLSAKCECAHTHTLSGIINQNRWRTKRFCMLFSSISIFFHFAPSSLAASEWQVATASNQCMGARV